jgi:hypothetical protein
MGADGIRLNRQPVPRVSLTVGDRVEFEGEKRRVRWTVRAVSADGRYAICTVPFNPQRTVLYTVLDFDAGVRGPDNYGGLGYETEEAIAAALARFESGEAEVSYRHDVHLRITAVNGQPVGGEAC